MVPEPGRDDHAQTVMDPRVRSGAARPANTVDEMQRPVWLPPLLALGVLLAACSGSDTPEATAPPPGPQDSTEPSPTEVADDHEGGDESASTPPATETSGEDTPTTEPTPETAPDTEPTESTASTDAATTTEPEAPATADSERRLAEDIGPVSTTPPFDDIPISSAPGEYYEIAEMTYLYVPFENDPDTNAVQPPRPEDYEILEDYARSRVVAAAIFRSQPIPIDLGDDVRRHYSGEALAGVERFATELRESGDVTAFPFDRPDVYRPFVLTTGRTESEATLFDCRSISSATVDDDGAVTEEAVPYFEAGAEVVMRLVDGTWQVTSNETSDIPCQL